MGRVLSSREKRIIQFIIESPVHVTIQHISDEIGVSRRTILREMPGVYGWFNDKNIVLEKHPTQGMFLNLPNSRKLLLAEALDNENVIFFYSQQERKTIIMTELLLNRDLQKLYYFASLLDVSEATISHDLDQVESTLEKYELTLNRKQGYGVSVEGTERNIRRALIDLMYETLDGNQIKNVINKYIVQTKDQSNKTLDIRKRLLDFIDYETIVVIENAISISEREMGFKFVESSYTALAMHLALAISRIHNGENIEIEQSLFLQMKTYEEFEVAEQLIEIVSRLLDIVIPESEIAYITMHLKGAKYKSGLFDNSIIKFNEMIISNYQLTLIVNQMILIATEESGYKLDEIDTLLIGLVDHLRPAINRMQMNLEIRNPLLDKIKEQYQDVYRISTLASKVIENKLEVNVPESEIGYIAMHIGSAIEQLKNKRQNDQQYYNVIVTCTSGIGTSNMLSERIKNEFQNIIIVETLSTTEISDELLKNKAIDLIISTVYFENQSVPVLTVNPLLLEKDIAVIEKKLTSIVMLKQHTQKPEVHDEMKDNMVKINNYAHSIIEILDHLIVLETNQLRHFKDFLSEACDRLTHTKKESKILMSELLEREKLGSVMFSEANTIFLHSRSQVITHLKVAIIKNHKPIKYANDTFQTAFIILAPLKLSQEAIEVIGQISKRIVNENQFLEQLSTLSYEELYENIQKHLNQFFYKKNSELVGGIKV